MKMIILSDVGSTFDFKGFVLKVFSYWQLILLSIAISLGVAYYNNVRKLPVYQLGIPLVLKTIRILFLPVIPALPLTGEELQIK